MGDNVANGNDRSISANALTAHYKLVSVQQRVPPCRSDPCSTYPSTGPTKYVLELNSGMADKLGVKAGDPISVKQ